MLRTNVLLRVFPLLVAFLSLLVAVQPASANEKYAAIVVDANTGETLFARNADAERYPASLTKMMTLYLVFEELEAGRLSLSTRLDVSANAAAQPPSKVGVRAGSTIKVEDAIQALTTKSANDVAVVVAENIGGSVSDFAARMNRTARALGMRSTTFRNPHGLPNNGQHTTARDLVRLATALQDQFPEYYSYFGVRTFTYRGTRYRNHNRLLGSVEGVDGIKTGYTRASGFNLVTNLRRDGRHIIAVVLGGKTAASRDAHMRDLIATYLPEARRGNRSQPLLLVDTGEAGLQLAEARLPRTRPAEEAAPAAPVLAYAAASPMRDLVSAAMAAPVPRPDVEQGDVSGEADDGAVEDLIAERIEAASAVADLAYMAPENAEDDPIARLTEMARLRAGGTEIVAVAASETAEGTAPAADPEGWYIQIGAVPTIEGAESLLEEAKAEMGPVLASVQPMTQEVDRNGQTLYRARFAGFSGKDAARAACDQLERQSFDCLAVAN